MRVSAGRVVVLVLLAAASPAMGRVAPFVVTGDAIEAPLAGLAGDRARGEAIVKNRETANCLICHTIPDPRERFMGNIGPPLAGVGLRLSAGQIRLRVVDPTLFNPQAVMPPYHRVEGLVNVDARYLGLPALGAQEIEDMVAYLTALED